MDTSATLVQGTLAALNATVDGVTDVSGFSSVRVQVAGTWVGQVAFQTSVDGINWVFVRLTSTSVTGGGAITTATSGNGVLFGDVAGRYFRVTTSSWTSGTANIAILYTPGASSLNYLGTSSSLRTAAAADGLNSGSVDEVALGAYNGSTIDRLLTANGVAITGQQTRALSVISGSTILTSVNAGTAVAAGTSLDNYLTRSNHTIQVDVTTTAAGTAGTHTIRLEASLDGSNWTPIATLNPAASSTTATDASNHAFAAVSDIPVRYIRANWTAVPTGWTGTLTARIASA